ncbi:MAG: beta-propeller fold lactonase family protein [Acetobacteraceae bacterium]
MIACLLGLAGCGHHHSPTVLQSIAISPASPSLAAGTSLQLTATALYSNGSHQDVTAQTMWSSSATPVATIGSGTGDVSGIVVGTTTVSASYSGMSATLLLTVTAATLKSIAITPTSAHAALGGTQQLTATGTYTDGSTQDLTATAVWSSSDSSIATVSAGLTTVSSSTIFGGTVMISAASGSVAGSDTLNIDVTGYAYVTSIIGNNVSQYQILSAGTLDALGTPTVAAGNYPNAVTITPGGQYAYVANEDDGSISEYSIGTDGSLTSIATTAQTTDKPTTLVVDPSGSYAYVANWVGSVSEYTIGSDGVLTPMTAPTVPAGSGPVSMSMDPTGTYLYVANSQDGTVSQYTVGAGGALAPMTPATVSIGLGSAPYAVVVDHSGQNAYVVNAKSGSTAGSVIQFVVGGGGALTAASTPAVATDDFPIGFTLAPGGQFAYVPNYNSNTVSQYAIGSGAILSSLSPPSASADRTPNAVAIDPTGQYAYSVNLNGDDITLYTIGTDGTLTMMGAPLQTQHYPTAIAILPVSH